MQKDNQCDNPNCNLIYSQYKALYLENMKLNELKKISDNHIKELEKKLSNSTPKSKTDKEKIFIINNNDNV